MNESNRPWVVVLSFAAAVHVAATTVVSLKSGAIDAYAFQSLDAREYYTIAGNLLDHGAFSQDECAPFRPDTWRTPGYPLFLTAIMAVAGKSPTAIILTQQLLNLLNVALLFAIARHRLSDRRAVIVAFLFPIEPYHLYYSFWLMSTTLQTTLILSIWLGYERAIKPVWLGILCGVLVLVWPGAILVPVALAILLTIRVIRTRTGRPLRAWRGPAVFVSACGAFASIWMLRNLIVAGTFALSHQSGIVLAYFKAAEVMLWKEGRTADRYLETSFNPEDEKAPHRVWESIDRALNDALPTGDGWNWRKLAQGNRTGTDSFVISQALTRIATHAAFEKPLSTLACCLTRMGAILCFPLDLAVVPPHGVGLDRLKSVLVGGVYTLLAGWVVVRLIRNRNHLASVAYPLACTFALLLAATPQTDPRFRVPMIPMLLFVALMPRKETSSSV